MDSKDSPDETQSSGSSQNYLRYKIMLFGSDEEVYPGMVVNPVNVAFESVE